MDAHERMKYFAKNTDGTMGDYLSRTDYEEMWEGELISPEFLKSYYSLAEMADLGNQYSANQYRKVFTTPTTYMTAKQRTFPNAYNEQLWQLGTGWNFNFSYMEVGSSLYNYKVLHLSDGRTFGVSPNWVNNLGHYTYKDIILPQKQVPLQVRPHRTMLLMLMGKKSISIQMADWLQLLIDLATPFLLPILW